MRLLSLPLLVGALLAPTQLAQAYSIPAAGESTSLEKRVEDSVDIGSLRCDLGRVIGGGGMGTVWKATAKDKTKSRSPSWNLAVKTSEDGGDMARGASYVKHNLNGSPHIMTVYGTTYRRGTTYMAMELMNGTTLESQMNSGAYDGNDRAIQGHVYQVLLGVAYMHSKGYAHTDLKGANMMLSSRDPRGATVKIVDPDLIIARHQAVSLCAPAGMLSPGKLRPIRSSLINAFANACFPGARNHA
jgi:serine/threonine protein kinase